MSTKLIELEDGTLVEVEIPSDQPSQISGGFADKVSSKFDKIQPLLVKICQPVTAALEELKQNMDVDQAEVEVGLSFEGEGNIYVTKTKGTANLTVKLTLKSKSN